MPIRCVTIFQQHDCCLYDFVHLTMVILWYTLIPTNWPELSEAEGLAECQQEIETMSSCLELPVMIQSRVSFLQCYAYIPLFQLSYAHVHAIIGFLHPLSLNAGELKIWLFSHSTHTLFFVVRNMQLHFIVVAQLYTTNAWSAKRGRFEASI